MGDAKRPRRELRGAVLAEFAIAFIPICAMFLTLCQLSRYAIARMAVMHAAEVSVRACAVIIEPDPGHESNPPLDGEDTDVQKAAHMAMKPFGGSDFGGSEIHISDPQCTHAGEENGGLDTVTMDATYTCTIPLAKHIVCSSGPKNFTVTAQFPHQGAWYGL